MGRKIYEGAIDGFKQCRTCKFTRQISKFHRHKKYADGYCNECCYCDKKRKQANERARVEREMARLTRTGLVLLVLCSPARAQVLVDTHAELVDHHGTPGIFLCQDAECAAFAWHAMHWQGDVLTFNTYGYGPIVLVDRGADIFLPGGAYLFKIDELIFDVPFVAREPYSLGITLESGAFGWLEFAGGEMTSRVTFDATGDFQLDGDTDGRDLLTWQRNPQLGDLAAWQAEYGGQALFSTPEPQTAVLLLLGLLLFARREFLR